jgi:hypothetical protein
MVLSELDQVDPPGHLGGLLDAQVVDHEAPGAICLTTQNIR